MQPSQVTVKPFEESYVELDTSASDIRQVPRKSVPNKSSSSMGQRTTTEVSSRQTIGAVISSKPSSAKKT